jgi:hypothetical protein
MSEWEQEFKGQWKQAGMKTHCPLQVGIQCLFSVGTSLLLHPVLKRLKFLLLFIDGCFNLNQFSVYNQLIKGSFPC